MLAAHIHRGGAAANHWLQNMYDSTDVCPDLNVYNDATPEVPNGTDPWYAFYEVRV